MTTDHSPIAPTNPLSVNEIALPPGERVPVAPHGNDQTLSFQGYTFRARQRADVDSELGLIQRMASFGSFGTLGSIIINEREKSVLYSPTLIKMFQVKNVEELFQVEPIHEFGEYPEKKTLLEFLLTTDARVSPPEIRAKFPDGQIGYLAFHMATVSDENGVVIERCAILRDVTEIRRNEEQLKKREVALLDSLKAGRVGVWQYDIASQEFDLSPEVYRQFEYSPDNPFTLEELISQVFDEADQPMARESLHNAIRYGRTVDYTAKIRDGNGETCYVYVIGVVVYDADGTPRRISGVVFDMTEKKRQEIELQESNARYKTLFEIQNDACFLLEDDRVTTCNHRMLELFGVENASELIGKTPWNLAPEFQPDGQSSREKALRKRKLCEEKKLPPFQWVAKRLDGTEFYVSVSLTRIPTEEKQIQLALVRDMTEEYLLNRAVEENQAYLQVLAEMRRSTYRRNEKEIVTAFLNSVTEQFRFAKSWYGKYDKVSGTVCPVVHFGERQNVIDGTIFSIDASRGQEEFPACTALVSRDCRIINDLGKSCDFIEWQRVAVEGDFNSMAAFPLEVNGRSEGVFVLYSRDKSINGNVVEYLRFAVAELARILSDRRLWEEQKRLLKQAKEKAEMAVEMKSRFLANMSHEIRTPMTAILGYTEALTDHEISRQKMEEVARIIRNNSEYLLHILNDILDYSKIEAEMMKIEMSSFPLDNLLSEIDSIFSVVAREKGLQFSVKNDTPYPAKIVSDPIRLKQIMLNLVGNAFKFTEKGKVEVAVSWSGDSRLGFGQLRIDVRDTGKGIPEDALDKIFNPFEQEDNSATRRYEGTGLGLAISRRLVRLLSGNLTVESTFGQGSVFSIFLPQQILPSTVWNKNIQLGVLMDKKDEIATPRNHSPLQNSRILLVEDGVDNQRLFSMILKKAGANVTLANNGQLGVEAVEKAIEENNPFDIILMDMQMPVMDGLTATKAIRSKGVQQPIVALTAHAMQEERDRCTEAGCTDFLTKPILRDALLSAVSNILDAQMQKQ